MNHSFIAKTLALLTAALCASSATAAPKLKVGDPAPKLRTGKWVQGDPVKELAPGTAYLVEYWATWCGPCRETIPHLNELHQKFKDKGLVVIGQNVWEEEDSAVAAFIKSMGSKMTYRVALDDKTEDEKGAMAMSWMKAAGQDGIPTAFVVDKKGLIAWIGHPSELTEKMLGEVLAGRFDAKKFAEQQEKIEALGVKFAASLRKRDWKEAEAALDEMEKLLPDGERSEMGVAKFKLYTMKGDFSGAYKLAKKLSDAHPDDAQLLNGLAWSIVADEGLENRDVALAEKIAERATKVTKGKDAAILDTLARAQFMNGKKKEAIETEQKAMDLAEGKLKTEFKKYLDSYKRGELPEVDN